MGGGGGILSPITDTLFGAPETVSTPNYGAAADATAANNLRMAQLATAANRVNQVTPYGALNYTQSGTDPFVPEGACGEPLRGSAPLAYHDCQIHYYKCWSERCFFS